MYSSDVDVAWRIMTSLVALGQVDPLTIKNEKTTYRAVWKRSSVVIHSQPTRYVDDLLRIDTIQGSRLNAEYTDS